MKLKKNTPDQNRSLTLNTSALMRGRQGRKTHDEFWIREDGIKIIGREDAVYKCIECRVVFPAKSFTTKNLRSDGAYYLQKRCRQCNSDTELEKRQVKKNAPPKPERCECCNEGDELLQIDHIHGTTIFRGWLCRTCNIGMGGLGDDLRGVLQATVYLENDKDKIIEMLHEVYDEMFARTNEEKF